MTNWFAGVATIIVGFWAGWVSIRVGRKLPHERLKQLADIRQELAGFDTEHVIDAAIERELRLLKQLNAAREVSLRRYLMVWMSQHFLGALGLASLLAGALASVFTLAAAEMTTIGIVLSVLALVVGVLALVADA